MAGNMFTGQGKKLIVIAVFLVIVAVLVGGEDDPGMIADLAGSNPREATRADAAAFAPPVENAPSQRAAPRREDPALSSWYAQSESTGAVTPQPVQPMPVDDGHLINDAQPLVSAEPVSAPSAVIIEDAAPVEIN